MAEATKYIHQLESTNRKQSSELDHLHPLAQKASISLEKIHTLETQLSLMDNLRKRATEMEIEITLLGKEKLAWSAFLDSTETDQRPEDIMRELSQERLAHTATKETLQRLETEITDLQKQARGSGERVDELTSQLAENKDQTTKLERRYERLERQKHLAQKEVMFLKEQLRTYDSEETMFLNAATVDAQKSNRIEQLEKLIEEYKSELDRLNKEGPLPSTVLDAKRKRTTDVEQDDESRRKIRVLQNGTPHLFSIKLIPRSNQITSIGTACPKRSRSN
jgi:mitotic spindle assembly checkpoint protein MAD1